MRSHANYRSAAPADPIGARELYIGARAHTHGELWGLQAASYRHTRCASATHRYATAVPLRQRCHVPLRTSSRDTCGRWQLVRGYSGGLLSLALDLGTRLLAAFDTPTGAVAQRTMRCTRWDVL